MITSQAQAAHYGSALRAMLTFVVILVSMVHGAPAGFGQVLPPAPPVSAPSPATARPALPGQLIGPGAPASPGRAGLPAGALPLSPGAVAEINPLEILDVAGGMLAGGRGRAAQSASIPGPFVPDGGGEASQTSSKGQGLSPAINVLLVLTVITLAPSIMLMTTCFVRFVIVLGLLKQALGTQTLPPPQVIVGLAMFMTFLVMAPTFDRINAEAVVPYRQGKIQDYDQLWKRVKQPMREFMFDQIEATGNWSSVYMILNYRGVDTSRPDQLSTDQVDMVALVPAFLLSELKTSFLIGFKVYLPFLVIDMVISAILISMGMMMLPPVLISLPFKLLLFVLVDGWQLVVGSLMQSFVTRGPSPSTAMLDPPWILELTNRVLPAFG